MLLLSVQTSRYTGAEGPGVDPVERGELADEIGAAGECCHVVAVPR